jgi:7,8-dihydro-6-hydroxymethylpterin-pyrophosphokinase
MKKKKVFHSLIEIEKEYFPEAFKRRLKKIKEDQERDEDFKWGHST